MVLKYYVQQQQTFMNRVKKLAFALFCYIFITGVGEIKIKRFRIFVTKSLQKEIDRKGLEIQN